MNARMMLKDEINAATLARRIEDATLNATAVREQLFYDGWLLRFAAESAKRMHSIHVMAPSSGMLDLDARLARCAQFYRQKGLPMMFRLTELGDNPSLDHEFSERGYTRSGETLVMVRRLDAPLDQNIVTPNGTPCVPLELAAFAAVLGRLKKSAESEIKAHARRLEVLVADELVRCINRMGEPIAVGLAVLEDDLVGVFDMAVATSHRRKGWGALLVCQLMADAAARGARYAYLQVDASNQAACRLYRQLGFQDMYTYWYRCAPSA